MPNCSRGDVILVRYPFSDLSEAKVRPAVVMNTTHESRDLLIIPLTSRTSNLRAGEFVLSDWSGAGLHIASVVKRGLYTVYEPLVLKVVGQLTPTDIHQIEQSLRSWLGL